MRTRFRAWSSALLDMAHTAPGHTSIGIDIGGTRVKAALVDTAEGKLLGTWTSPAYTRPDRATLLAAVRAAAEPGLAASPSFAGLCCPGVTDPETGVVRRSVNVPGLEGLSASAILGAVGGSTVLPISQYTDAFAAAIDVYCAQQLTGRLLAVSLGTGVGAAVIDDGPRQLLLHGISSGHLGQMVVSLSVAAPIGPDGGRGSLEGYIGWPALVARYGMSHASLMQLDIGSEPVLALVRALRIAHAIYKPTHIRLLGGVSLMLTACGDRLRGCVARDLTCVAHPDWTLGIGTSEHHAACGAARLAGGCVRSARPTLPT